MLRYKLMIIDDEPERQGDYQTIFDDQYFELLFIQNPDELRCLSQETPVDAYVIDAILDTGAWSAICTAATLFEQNYLDPPRPTPVFLISRDWSDPNALKVLNMNLRHARNIEALRCFAWQELEEASQTGDTGKAKLIALREKIRSDLAIWHEHSTLNIPLEEQPCKTIRILLLSDLQYTDPHTSDAAHFDELSIGKVLNRENLVPHLIAITGDIGFTGEPNDYHLAKQKIESLMSYMWTEDLDKWRERLILVPGNHDVNLRMSSCNQYNWKREEKTWEKRNPIENRGSSTIFNYQNYALEPFRQFAKDITGSRYWDSYLTKCRVDRRFEALGLRFYLFNTVEKITVDAPKKYVLSPENIGEITRELSCKDKPEDFFNLAFSHHGNISHDSPEEIVDNWSSAGKVFFSEQKMKLWCFGHQHKADRPQPEELDDDCMLYRVEVPTLKIKTIEGLRGFSVIELDREHNKVTEARVHQFTLNANGKIEASSSNSKPLNWI